MSARLLSVDPPRLLREDTTPYGSLDAIRWDQLLNVETGPIRDVSGAVLSITALRRVACYVVRQEGGEQLWHEVEKRWVPADFGGLPARELELFPLVPKDLERESEGWSGKTMLSDAIRFTRGAERFAVRCYAEGVLGGEPVFGWSERSLSLPIAVDPSLRLLFEMEEGRLPSWARIYAGLPLVAEVRVDERSGQPRVQIRGIGPDGKSALVRVHETGAIELVSRPDDANFTARISLPGDGSIVLQPAEGREVVVDGNLRVTGTVTP